MTYVVGQFINGAVQVSDSDRRLDIIDPSYGERVGEVCFADEVTVNQTVESAKQAQLEWAQTPPMKRARVLFRFKELLEKNFEELAQIVTREHGKTIEDAKGSVMRGIELVEYNCSIAHRLSGSFSSNVGSNIDCHTQRQALGVCVGVSPFNFPVMVPVWMIVPAIACGNSFILKPSEQDPSAPLKLCELLHEAGLPKGVLSLLNGDKAVVDQLIRHPDVSAVTAVASTPVAEAIYTTAIAHGKRAHTFGGAKNHCIVMNDADIEQAADAITGAAFGSAGERCMALSVAIAVGETTGDRLVAAIKQRLESLRIGPGSEAGMDMGPLISSKHLSKVKALVDRGVDEGAALVADGRNLDTTAFPNGYFLGPCLFDQVTEAMEIYQQEIFGPVLCVMRADSFEDALAIINRNQYGNGTAIFTHDGDAARTFADRVEVGMVGINIPIPVPVAYHPFGGWKRSAFGDLAMHGNQSVQFYTRVKTVTTRWPKGIRLGNSFAMPTLGV